MEILVGNINILYTNTLVCNSKKEFQNYFYCIAMNQYKVFENTWHSFKSILNSSSSTSMNKFPSSLYGSLIFS